MCPEFKVPEDDGSKREDTNISISILDLKKFNQIKGNLSYYRSRKVGSKEVMQELIATYIESKRKSELIGDTN